ncbi:receptor [Shigella sonnei]|nr:receptor [Shigella sonnei]
MELKKLMEHISIIPDYRQAWKVEHKLSDILLLTICAVISGAEGWEDIEDFGETHLDFLKQYGDFENGQMIKTSLQLMEKRSGTLMTRVAAGERFMSLVRSQQCTVWSSDRSRRMRNLMRLQLSQNFLTCWILKEKSSQLMRWVARKILQRRYKNREVIIYLR